MVVNACYDEGRRTRRRAEVSLIHLADHQTVDPTARFAESERIDRAFRRLPLEQRTVLVLQHQFGMSHVEIAETLGIPVGTVKSRIRYGTGGDARSARGRRPGRSRRPRGGRHDHANDPTSILGGVLGAWMNDAAPASIPVSSSRRRSPGRWSAPQARVYPWQRLARRSSHPRRLTLLSIAATAALLVGVLGFGVFGGGSGFGPGPSPSPPRHRRRDPHRPLSRLAIPRPDRRRRSPRPPSCPPPASRSPPPSPSRPTGRPCGC